MMTVYAVGLTIAVLVIIIGAFFAKRQAYLIAELKADVRGLLDELAKIKN